MTKVLRVDADDGNVTPFATAFRDRMVFGELGPLLDLVDRTGADAVRSAVTAAHANPGIGYVTCAGHGSYGAFYGTDGAAVWDHESDLSLFAGQIVHLLACECGASLGLRMVGAGALAFWGYTVEFLWLYQRDRPADLADDDVAADFFQMDVIIDRGILAGKSAQDIYDSIERYVAKVIPTLPRAGRALLLSNFVHLAWPGVSWGDRAAVL